MSRVRKFIKQAARGRRTFNNNLYRALSGLNLASLTDDETVICRPPKETTQDKVARLRSHLEVYGNDGDARKRYEELRGLPSSAIETQKSAPVLEAPIGSSRGPEFLGVGGGRWGSCEVYIAGNEGEARPTEEEWLVMAQAAKSGAYV